MYCKTISNRSLGEGRVRITRNGLCRNFTTQLLKFPACIPASCHCHTGALRLWSLHPPTRRVSGWPGCWQLWFHVLASSSPCKKHHISNGLCYISNVFSWNRVSCICLYCYKSCRPLKAWSCFSESQFQVPFPEPCDFSSLYVYIRRRHLFVGGAGRNCMTFAMPFFQCLDKKLMFDLLHLLKVWIPKTDLSKVGHLNWTVNLKPTFHSLGRTKQWWLSLWVREDGNGLERSQSPKIHPAGAPGRPSREEWTEIQSVSASRGAFILQKVGYISSPVGWYTQGATGQV